MMVPQTTTRPETLCDLFTATAAQYEGEVALRSPDDRVAFTWGEYAAGAGTAAAGFAGIGVRRGDTVAFWMGNRPEFHVADAGALLLGATPFSVYPTLTVEHAEHVIGNARSRILVTEPACLDRALAVLERGRTALEQVVLVEGEDSRVLGWEDLLSRAPAGFDLRSASAAIQPGDLATLIYTSGTTGPPKGVQLTHRNIVAQVRALQERIGFPAGARVISWLPMAHIAERLQTQYVPMALGWQVTTCSDPRAIADLIVDVRPGFFFSPPRLWEKLRAGVLAAIDDDARAAIDAAVSRVRAGEGVQDNPVGAALRERVGFDELRAAIVGAAPCPAEVIEFWHAVGVPLGELYGLSECTGVATVNPPGAIRIGTVGTPIDGVEVRLSEKSEILIRGPVVMSGYRDLPEATAETIDADGWLHSGDVGAFDEDGYLRIVDRIKELIINAAGKNMSPSNIEATVKSAGELIGQVCVIGDSKPYNVALVTLDPDALAAFAARLGIAASATHAHVRAGVAEQIERANARLARVEQLKNFALLEEDWLPDGDELTPTMKLKRRPIAAKYALHIEALYRA